VAEPGPGRRRAIRRLALGAAGLVIVLAAVLLARAPVPAASAPGAGVAGTDPEAAPHTHVGMAGMVGMTGAAVPIGGTSASAGGYTFVPAVTDLSAGDPGTFRFHIQGPDGRAVTRFAIVHDRPLHLIVVRHDLTGFQHLHPTMAPDGTWSVPLTLPAPGTYRAYADFSALDAKGNTVAVVLGVDLTVPGTASAGPLPSPSTVDTVDGLTVSYVGTPKAGVTEPLLFSIKAGGRPVAPEPYLGAYGHLVVLRPSDLGYLHVHPEPELTDGATKFWLAAPGTGDFRMYLDFQVAGVVHTAAFTIAVN
jgi:hypothetical protein